MDLTPRNDDEADLTMNRQPHMSDAQEDRFGGLSEIPEWSDCSTHSADREYEKEKRWRTHFGDTRSSKGPQDKDIARFITHNIGGFPEMGSTKFLRLREELANVDCAGLSEINRNWYKINAQDSLHRRIQHWWPMQKTQLTWLKDYEWPSRYQQGGVSLSLASDRLSKYRQEHGDDSSGLGRWCWSTLEGHSDVKTAIVQIYRPTKNTTNNGSTYIQQQVASGEDDPIKIFDKDLIEMVDMFCEF